MTSNEWKSITIKLPEKPMKDKFSDLILEDYIVAYIDILGFTNIINNDESGQHLKLIFNIYNQALAHINSTKKIMSIEEIKIKLFSDNILLAIKLNKNYTKEELIEKLYKLVFILRYFQFDFLLNTYTLRGGITLGKLFINDFFIYGKGLLDSYNMESKLAIFPRIIINETLIKNIQHHKSVLLYLEKDFDSFYFVDYLTLLFSGTCNETLSNIRKIIIYLTQQNNNEKVKQKYYWLINKFNEKCIGKYKRYTINMEKEPIYKLSKIEDKEFANDL